MNKHKQLFSSSRIIPCDPTAYDVAKSVAVHPFTEWRQNCKPDIGSTIYVYFGLKGGQQLRYEFTVVDTDFYNPTIDDMDCVLKPAGCAKPGQRLMRLKFVREIPVGSITLQDMLDHGLSKFPQNQVRVPAELQKYIDSILK